MGNVAIGIQARSTSDRFPRKSLQSILGIPLIAWVIEGCKKVDLPVWVLTSDDKSDDDLAFISAEHGAKVFRGSLKNVLCRYKVFVESYGLTHVIRINGDSPLISPDVIMRAVKVSSINASADLITNVFPRTFPKGQSVEIIRSTAIKELAKERMTESNIEHITSFFYDNSRQFQICNFTNNADLSQLNLCVDFPEDLFKIERFLKERNILSPSRIPAWTRLSKLIQANRLGT